MDAYIGEAALLWLVAIGILWIVAHVSNKKKAKEQVKEEQKQKKPRYLYICLREEEED